MVMYIYVAVACTKNGIWDRHLKPNAKSNLIASLIASLITDGMMFAAVFRNHPDKPEGSIAAGVFAAGFTFCKGFILPMEKAMF